MKQFATMLKPSIGAAGNYRVGWVAEGLSRRVLEMKPGHAGASQLKRLIASGRGVRVGMVEQLLWRCVES